MNSASTSPSSGESVQRNINSTSLRHDDLRSAPTSPRIAILSQTSLQHPVPEPTSASTADSRSHGARALEKRREVPKKSSSDRRKRTTTHSDLSLVNLSRLELDRLRNDPKAESFKMRDLLETAVRQVHVESKRAEELQRINDETAMKFRVLNENRVSAQHDAAKAKTELKLYQFQLDNAQKEIEKAKTALKEIEKQRDEAEEAAARAREKARKYQQERLVAVAREDGRRLGYEAGLKHAKKEKEILAAGRPRALPQPPSRSNKGKERAHNPGDYGHQSRSRRSSHARDDNASSPEYSSSQTPKRNFRGSNRPVPPSQQIRPGSTAPQRFRPPPDREEEEDDYESESEESHPPLRPARATTPSIQYWPVEIPAADKLNESFNSNEHPNDAVPQGPREAWVTAHQHHEMRSSSNPPMRPDLVQAGTKTPIVLPQTPHLVPFSDVHPMPSGSISGPVPVAVPLPSSIPHAGVTPPKPPSLAKSVKFWARRPTLAKTKLQATSWYRSFSLRRKNKPVIDPIPEEPTASPYSGAPVTSTFPEGQAASVDSSEGVGLYGPRPHETQSWYRSSGAPSLRNRDMPYARRQHSDAASVVSTRVSQFDLLSTPALQSTTSISLPRTKNKGHVKEKESFLSVIKEDSSRGNTPERSLGVGGMTPGAHAMPQPTFAQPSGFYQTSHAASTGSAQNRHSHRPPSIYVPDSEAAGQSAGVATYQGYPSNTDLLRKPSIDIDVVPPSGTAPDDGTSPPHTGRNHLSPYHVFRPEESIRSLRDAIDSFARQPARPESAASNSRPGYSRTGSGAGPRGPYDSPLENPRPFMTWNGSTSRPGSVRPSPSNNHLRNVSSTATFKVANPDPPQPDNRSTRTRGSSRAQPMLSDIVAHGEHAGVVLTPRREPSRASLKSTKSYSRYNPDEYVDPAFWGVNGPGDPPPEPRPGMERAASGLSRKTSVDSRLSYA